MTTRVAVLGVAGRMGAMVCRAVADDPELSLVGGVDPSEDGREVAAVTGASVGPEMVVFSDPSSLPPTDVVVDFTHIDAARRNLAWAASAGVHAVVGTSGFTEDDYEQLRSSFTSSNCLVAPNFAIGAVLMMRFAELAAPWFPSAEVVELHHDQKLDAPSGTAMRTVERMEAASTQWNEDPTRTETWPGARGAQGASGGVRVHALRLQGLVAHQEVVLGSTGETLTVRHDSYDRSSFMPGVVLACKQVPGLAGVTVGLDGLLGL